ncbi:hypothetical protein DPMN_154668 [Dreissena polymorpha]|uniref:Uncharacterized protein n=1 Tax=Dreissena polymorpha TaxID=45954 RepID=A0A9D4FKX7_DREPO|nr:hypothetical protein DPMN_154668 [Dreissena polymorpha]
MTTLSSGRQRRMLTADDKHPWMNQFVCVSQRLPPKWCENCPHIRWSLCTQESDPPLM